MGNNKNTGIKVMGPILTVRGKPLLLPTVVLLRVLWFLPTITSARGGIPSMIGECVEQEN